jgi:hypothetical protein
LGWIAFAELQDPVATVEQDEGDGDATERLHNRAVAVGKDGELVRGLST